ncbi:MAG TPA: MFS transporter, partial [Calidithermus sp.]|nr:MFS transporter [Calidithermus sp.]
MTRWIAAGGAFVVSLDSMVNIAFPSLVATFGAPPEHARWVIVAYVLMYALLSLGGGALGDRVGHERVFALGLAGTGAAYLVAGLAPTFGWLLAGRVVQGVAGGFVYGSAPAMATRGAVCRARALGFLNGAIGDLNPFYLDDEVGRASPWGDIIAPPTFAISFRDERADSAALLRDLGVDIGRV